MNIFHAIRRSRIGHVCRSFRLSCQNEKGVALIFTFIVMIALTASVIGYLSFVQAGSRNAGNQVSDRQAFHLAEAGLHRAIYYLINGNTAPDSSTDGSWRTDDYDNGAGTGEEESFANGTYTMFVEDSGGRVLITSVGEMDNIERVVQRSFTTANWTEITNDTFEVGFGNWVDGGNDCSIYTGGTRAHEGDAAVRIRDNTSQSVVSTNNLTLSAYNMVKVDFWYYANGMETGEDFWLQISTNGGTDYTTVQSWAEGTAFSNNTFYEESVIISGYTLTDTTRIRFRNDASQNNDHIYLDEIVVSATADAAGNLIDVANSWMEL